jgi:acyl-CoA synthetase (AMP-forming)/AMP-acid ligase II
VTVPGPHRVTTLPSRGDGMSLVPDQLRLLAEDHPDECAYVVGAEATTFRAWDRSANRLARGLMDRGLRIGDRVVQVIDPQDAARHIELYIGVHKAGGVNVPLDSGLSERELATLVQDADPSAVIVSARHQGLLGRRGASIPIRGVTGPSEDPTVLGWGALLHDEDADLQAEIGPDDIADIIYTSGTTGSPKGVVSRHRNTLQLPVGRPRWNGMHWCHASPLATTAGTTFVVVPMQLGMTGVYLPRFDAGLFLDLAERGQVQMAFLVPSMVELLLEREDLHERDLSGLRMVTVGGAPAAAASLLALDDLLPDGVVLHSYALTESGRARVVLPADQIRRRPSSVGKPMPPTRVEVVDGVGNPLPAGEIGEVRISTTAHDAREYVDPEATRTTWRDGWLLTGDLGRLDDEGYLYIVGRTTDVISRGGYDIPAGAVETVLCEHPAVAAAAVVGVRHAVLGEDVVAVVITRREVSADELRLWCSERLSHRSVPRRIEFRDRLPTGPHGKVRKAELRAELDQP